jgi:hypothetical protein
MLYRCTKGASSNNSFHIIQNFSPFWFYSRCGPFSGSENKLYPKPAPLLWSGIYHLELV